MAVTFFSGKSKTKRIALLIVACVLVVVFIGANIALDILQPLLHEMFSPTAPASEEAMAALGEADDLIGEIAEESFVLLKNDEDFLPLEKESKVNLFGWASTDHGFLMVGGGSGGSPINKDINPKYLTLKDAFDEYADLYEFDTLYNETLSDAYENLYDWDADFKDLGGTTGDTPVRNMLNPDSSFYTEARMNDAKDFSTTAVVVLSRWGCENGGDGELVSTSGEANRTRLSFSNGNYLELTDNEKTIFDALDKKDFNVIVLLNTTNPLELGFLEEYDCIKSCLFIGTPGQSGARAVPWVLYGEKKVERLDEDGEGTGIYDEVQVSPSGRLSDTYAYDWQTNNPVYPNATKDSAGLVYQEGIYFGYKWYETADEEGFFDSVTRGDKTGYDAVVQFPFGYGLSYTTFTQAIVDTGYIDEEGKHVSEAFDTLEADTEYYVTVHVINTGDRRGAEVVQLYYTAPYTPGGIEKASVNLLAFGKTVQLEPHGTVNEDGAAIDQQDITLTFTAYDMASYDASDANANNFRGYEIEEGDYALTVRANAHAECDGCDPIEFFCDEIKFDEDPVTHQTVENRFTGSSAYGNMPIDGSTGISGGVKYLSREDFAGTFPTDKTFTTYGEASSSAVNRDATGNVQWDDSDIQYGVDAQQYLTLVEADGTKPTRNDLQGKTGARSLKINEDLFEVLADYDAEEWDEFLDQLSQQEVARLILNGGFRTYDAESIAKPNQANRDGPAGFNRATSNAEPNEAWAVFPAETLVGCSWNTRLTYNIGRAQGVLGNTTDAYGWYAPGVNLHRSAYNTRNYEYYSEDAVLSGHLGAETVRGAKQTNLYCYVKHFVLSDNGQNAKDWNEWITEQTLREVYLKPFEICVKEGGANAMMSAFNRLGTIWCGYNRALLTDILRSEWGFRGSVITDWHAAGDYMAKYELGVRAGNDLWLFGLGAKDDTASLDLSTAANRAASRQSAKNIIYTYVDTYMAAKDYAENGDDSYNVTLGTGVSTAPYSPVVPALWAVIDVVLILGIGACVLFMFIPKKQEE